MADPRKKKKFEKAISSKTTVEYQPTQKQEMKKTKKYAFGTAIADPNAAIYQNDINRALAQRAGLNNPWAKGLAIGGGLAQVVGQGIMSSAAPGTETEGLAGFFTKNSGSIMEGANMLQGLGGMFAMGGEVPGVPVEVEGKEVGETPQGELLEFKGASHEEGGIKTTLPKGTEMYSNRILVAGVTMADRKKKREKKRMTLEKLLENSNKDSLLKNTMKRTQEVNALVDEQDRKIQEVVKQAEEGNPEKYALGGNTDPSFKKRMKSLLYPEQNPYSPFTNPVMGSNDGVLSSFNPTPFNPKYNGTEDLYKPDLIDKWGRKPIPTGLETEKTPPLNRFSFLKDLPNIPTEIGFEPMYEYQEPEIPDDGIQGKSFSFGNGPTAGDVLGMAGNWYQADKILDTIYANRAGEQPEVNPFLNYGKEGLETLDSTRSYINQLRDSKLLGTETARNSASKAGRNSARSANTQRALDIALNNSTNDSNNQIYDTATEQMLNILSTKAQMQNQRDAQVMQGEFNKNTANTQNRDNYYTQLTQGLKNVGQTISQTGHDLNDIKYRGTSIKALSGLGKYHNIDQNANITAKDNINILNAGGMDFLNGMTPEELDEENKAREKAKRLAIAKSKRKQNKIRGNNNG